MGFARLAPWFDAPVDAAGVVERTDGGSVLAPLLTDDAATLADQIGIAAALARADDTPLTVVVPTRTGRSPRRQVPGGADADDAELVAWARERASASRPGRGLTAGRRMVADVNGMIATSGTDAVVLPGDSPGSLLGGNVSERVATHADCDAVVVNGQSGLGSVPSILLPVAGGPHSELAVDVAERVARDAGAWIDVLHVVEGDATDERRERAEARVATAARRIGRQETTSTWVLDADDPTDAIVEQSRYYPLTVVGAPTKGRLHRFVHGSTSASVRSRARSVVLSVRTDTQSPDGG